MQGWKSIPGLRPRNFYPHNKLILCFYRTKINFLTKIQLSIKQKGVHFIHIAIQKIYF